VSYPLYRDLEERIRTTGVSLTVDHPEFALVNNLHIDVPHTLSEPFHISLKRGISVTIHPVFDDPTTDASNLFFLWSDGRSYQEGIHPVKLPNGDFQIPAMPPGDNSVMAVKLDGERASHFSAITEFHLAEDEEPRVEVELKRGVRIQVTLSSNVPRPINNGRVSAWTLAPARSNGNRVTWLTWARINPDGTFVIESWPADEPLQLIALCDGYIAASGSPPDSVEDPATDTFQRPQVFNDFESTPIEVTMEALVRCEVTVKDEDDKPLTGITVASWPNVCWWNDGSQIYCHPLVRGEKRLTTRSYQKSIDNAFPDAFQSRSDATGKATLFLPAGTERLAAESEDYELLALLGSRSIEIKLIDGRSTSVALNLQPKGTEKLGEWDKLAGVVFGCSTREGRRICALPGVRKKMDAFAVRFRVAKNLKDPQLLSEAYTVVAEAFEKAGDLNEAVKWQQKAAEQAEKAKAKADKK